jgi:hypothetical protein
MAEMAHIEVGNWRARPEDRQEENHCTEKGKLEEIRRWR